MKIFAIRDDLDSTKKDVAYLIYYERDKQFYIELPEHADPWETPLLLSSFLKRGETTINAYWSRIWVQQRIIPSNRQNLGQILKENNLDEYDEFCLLMLADGRCAQDDYYLAPIREEDLPKSFLRRFQKKVEDVVPLSEKQLLVFFRDGAVKKCNIEAILKDEITFSLILRDNSIFKSVRLQPGGYGVYWGEENTVADDVLYDCGKDVPLSLEDFRSFVENRVVTTTEAAELLECSRQNINDLIQRNKLHPVKVSPKNKLFLKSEILQRKWMQTN